MKSEVALIFDINPKKNSSIEELFYEYGSSDEIVEEKGSLVNLVCLFYPSKLSKYRTLDENFFERIF